MLRAPLRDLAARLDGRVPLPEALARFADDVDDPAADLVVAALTLNARQRAGGLDRILTSLAASSRAELEMRRKVELERRGLRRQAQRIAGRGHRFRGPAGNVRSRLGRAVLDAGGPAGAGAADGVVRGGVRADAVPGRRASLQPRFLTSAEAVTEIASYKPGWSDRPRSGGARSEVIAFMIAIGCLAAAALRCTPTAWRCRHGPTWSPASGDGTHARARASRVQRIGAPAGPDSPSERAVRWVAEQLSRRTRDLSRLNQDLAITGTTLEAHLSKTLDLGRRGAPGGPIVDLGHCSTSLARSAPVGGSGPLLGIALAAAWW